MLEFVPEGYVHLSVAATYAFAKMLACRCNSVDEERCDAYATTELSSEEGYFDSVQFDVSDVELVECKYTHYAYRSVGLTLILTGERYAGEHHIVVAPPLSTAFDNINIRVSGLPSRTRLSFTLSEEAIGAFLRQRLAEGSIEAVVIGSGGIMAQVPDDFWRTIQGWSTIMNGNEAAIAVDGRLAVGDVLVPITQIEALFSDPGEGDKDWEPPYYISEYLSYMLRASRELNLSPDRRIAKEDIEDWVRKNWAPDLGQISNKLVSSMATFLRRPDDARGGNVRIVRAKDQATKERQSPVGPDHSS